MGPFCFVLKKKKEKGVKRESAVEDCDLPQTQTKTLEIK